MKSLFVAVVSLLSLSAQGLVAQSSPGTTALCFTLIEVTDHGNVLKDVEPFMIQVDGSDSSSHPPSSNL
ncbi:MAG: hypothetical protein NT164_04020 [Verrucomicrobiae bacterium]|nr:hypothetical protein [Verrucomicrobiae bacterium]